MTSQPRRLEQHKKENTIPEWGGHTNGQIPASALSAVPALVAGSGYLRSDAAAKFRELSDAFQARFGSALVIREGYRSYDRQVYLYDGWTRKLPGFNYAAPPGTSNHGWATACDFASSVDSYGTAQKNWMDANAPAFGWSPTGNGFPVREPWHFDYTLSYTDTGEEDLTPDQDQRLKNIEAILATDDFGGIRAKINAGNATSSNIEKILAVDNSGGMRALLQGTRDAIGNVEKILAVDSGGGIRATVNAIRAKLGA